MSQALAALTFLPPLRLQVNNRKLIEGFYRGVGASDTPAVMRVIDKIDKLAAEEITRQLVADAGLSIEQAGSAWPSPRSGPPTRPSSRPSGRWACSTNCSTSG